MRQLNYDLKTQLAENPERGHVTRRDRADILDQAQRASCTNSSSAVCGARGCGPST